MRRLAIMAAILTTGLSTGAASAQGIANPYAYTCGTYIAAQQGDRSQANAMLYWATGYLQGRLGALPTTKFTAENFGQGIQDVHNALLQICPNVPNMVVAEFMSNFAGDFEKTAKPLQ
jgi:hypothetical protein